MTIGMTGVARGSLDAALLLLFPSSEPSSTHRHLLLVAPNVALCRSFDFSSMPSSGVASRHSGCLQVIGQAANH
jgi:hypothetical protein